MKIDHFLLQYMGMAATALAIAAWTAAGLQRWAEQGRKGSEFLWMLAGPYGWPAVSERATQLGCRLMLPWAPVIGEVVWQLDAWRKSHKS